MDLAIIRSYVEWSELEDHLYGPHFCELSPSNGFKIVLWLIRAEICRLQHINQVIEISYDVKLGLRKLGPLEQWKKREKGGYELPFLLKHVP